MNKTFEQLFEEHAKWTDATFPKATSDGAMIHAIREAYEVIECYEENHSITDKAIEIADFVGCLANAIHMSRKDTKAIGRMLDFLCDTGVTLVDVRRAFSYKQEINKARTWKDNGDGSYSHIKQTPTP